VTDLTLSTVADGIVHTVPFVRTLGMSFVELGAAGGDVRAVVELPDQDCLHNHVGGPHAGALFTLGETASGAVVLAAFAHCLDRAVPLTLRAEVNYVKLAMGPVRATARLGRPPAEVVAELDSGVRPEVPVLVEIARADGTVTASMTVVWTLRPNRP
jgi:acyl-coenzyme A thioesterase PaaI-like protein